MKAIFTVFLIFIGAQLTLAQGPDCKQPNYLAQVSDITKQLIDDPDNAQLYVDRGRAYNALLKRSEALADFNKSLELDSKLGEAYVGRGGVYDRRGDYRKAIENYDKATQLITNSSETYYIRGRAYDLSGDTSAASRDFEKAHKLDSEDGYPYFALATLSKKAQDSDGVERYVSSGLEVVGRQIESAYIVECKANRYLLRGLLKHLLGDKGDALNDISIAVEMDPSDVRFPFYRGLTNLILSNYSAAALDLTSAIKLDPEFALAYEKRAAAYDKLSEKSKADADREMVAKLRQSASLKAKTGK